LTDSQQIQIRADPDPICYSILNRADPDPTVTEKRTNLENIYIPMRPEFFYEDPEQLFELRNATHSFIISSSVADPGCLSRIPDPDFYPSRIPDLGSRIQKQQQKRGVKKFYVIPFYVATNFKKLYFTFEVLKKKICSNFQRIIELFTQKIVTKFSKVWVWDPGSGKNLFRIPGSKRHRIPDPDPQR
jgi:hypothetical protein